MYGKDNRQNLRLKPSPDHCRRSSQQGTQIFQLDRPRRAISLLISQLKSCTLNPESRVKKIVLLPTETRWFGTLHTRQRPHDNQLLKQQWHV
eukprot:gnl/MRDRNA2_/MRDRNA2_49169_c0_seq1.p1 gnl/MRDRNA2_/MRDRNA2_49169_c0~~gnl/MRDRNA2_/MRDRNA2_49169_c0_seq1.p1  ORF type:complete len:107 (-),score=9.75 gnl/MRDRNA2_/MRDRNA2_49169_c0_seq1:125-400(-)